MSLLETEIRLEIMELLQKAKRRLTLEESMKLAKSPYTKVRRQLAKCTAYPNVLERLSADSTVNVAYPAIMNPYSREKRLIFIDEKSITPCIKCVFPEDELECEQCKDYKN